MKTIRLLSLSWIIIILALGPCLAQDKVVKVTKEKSAPFTGLLVPEERFTLMLEAEIEVEHLKGNLAIQKKLTTSLERVYDEKLREAVKPRPWHEKPSFNRWLGFGIGVVMTVLAIWGGAELGKAFR